MNLESYSLEITRIYPKLYKIAILQLNNESIAKDVVDETVYIGLKNISSLKYQEYFDTWLIRILINECTKERKRRKRYIDLEEYDESYLPCDNLPLKDAINHLPQNLRNVIILHFFNGYTLNETSKILEFPIGTIATWKRKALYLLKIELQEEICNE